MNVFDFGFMPFSFLTGSATFAFRLKWREKICGAFEENSSMVKNGERVSILLKSNGVVVISKPSLLSFQDNCEGSMHSLNITVVRRV